MRAGSVPPFRLLPREETWRGWVRKAAEGDEHSLARLYDETNQFVHGIALRILGAAADAEEVTLDVYSQVWRTAASFSEERGTVTAWLSMLTRSRALDRLRSSAARSRNTTALSDTFDIPSEGHDPEQASFLGQQSKLVRQALSGLSPEQREAIELAYFHGLTQSEISSQLKQPLGTVKTRIRSGMIKLRDSLEVLAGATQGGLS